MEDYPVKPGTAVYVPSRPEPVERKPLRVIKEKTPEEQVVSLHKLVQILLVCVLGLATTLAVTVGVLVYALSEEIPQETEPRNVPTRRNYTTSAPQNED